MTQAAARFWQEHPAFKWKHLKADKMLEIQICRTSFARKTADTFAHDALYACFKDKIRFPWICHIDMR
jgi:hypothetical protein